MSTNKIKNIKLIAIKVNFDFDFKKHLYLLNIKSQSKVLSYKFKRDQVIAFTSEILKYYYLANYLTIKPENIIISYAKYGRPFLLNNPQNIDFNITHSGEYIIMAIVHNATVGIDIEKIKHNIIPSQLSKIVFSEIEQKLIGNNIENFFTLWTKKEAFIKACGNGFSNDSYLKTSFGIEEITHLPEWAIYSKCIFDTYYMSICLNI